MSHGDDFEVMKGSLQDISRYSMIYLWSNLLSDKKLKKRQHSQGQWNEFKTEVYISTTDL